MRFNQPLVRVTFPAALRSLKFGHMFNCSLSATTLPAGLTTLTFGNMFDQHTNLNGITLPKALRTLTFGFETDLEGILIPPGLEEFSCNGVYVCWQHGSDS